MHLGGPGRDKLTLGHCHSGNVENFNAILCSNTTWGDSGLAQSKITIKSNIDITGIQSTEVRDR